MTARPRLLERPRSSPSPPADRRPPSARGWWLGWRGAPGAVAALSATLAGPSLRGPVRGPALGRGAWRAFVGIGDGPAIGLRLDGPRAGAWLTVDRATRAADGCLDLAATFDPRRGDERGAAAPAPRRLIATGTRACPCRATAPRRGGRADRATPRSPASRRRRCSRPAPRGASPRRRH